MAFCPHFICTLSRNYNRIAGSLILFGIILGLFLADDMTLFIAFLFFVQDAYYQPELKVWDDAKRFAIFVVVAIVFLLFISVLVAIAGEGGSSVRNKRLKS